MKNYHFKRILFVYSTLFTGGYCGLASSHDLSGSLPDPSYAVDVYNIQCSTDSGGESDYLETSIIDVTQTPGGGKLYTEIKAGGVVTQSVDPVRDDGNFSTSQSVHAGNHVYEVFVRKQKNGQKVYGLEYHCKSSTGQHTGTSAITVQDQ